MKRENITVSTQRRTQFVSLDDDLNQYVRQQGLSNGWLTIFVPHTTAGITINENADPDVLADLEQALEALIPWRANYRHAEGNAAAHVKASLMGASVRIPVRDGRLQLGTWQSVFFCEFDGPRQRTIWLSGSSD